MSHAEQMLSLLTKRAESQREARAAGSDSDPHVVQMLAEIEKIFKQGKRRLTKAQRDSTGVREPTAKRKKQNDLEAKKKKYVKMYTVDAGEASAKQLLRAFFAGDDEEFYTQPSGLVGSNKARSFHGGTMGCFLITSEERKEPFGAATIWQADDNKEDLPEAADFGDGAADIEDVCMRVCANTCCA